MSYLGRYIDVRDEALVRRTAILLFLLLLHQFLSQVKNHGQLQGRPLGMVTSRSLESRHKLSILIEILSVLCSDGLTHRERIVRITVQTLR